MSEESNKSSIFLSIVIVFLLVAMGVYGFIYRDKLTEFFQKFQKKNEQVEKHTIYNNNSLSEKDSTEVDPQKGSPAEKDTASLSLPKEEETIQPKKEIEEMVYGNVPGDDTPSTPSPTKKNKKLKEMEYSKNLPDGANEAKLSDNKLGMEFVGMKTKRSKLKAKSQKSNKKRKYSSSKRIKTRNSLLVRVSKLERALGVKSNPKEKLEKRIERLEMKLKKK